MRFCSIIHINLEDVKKDLSSYQFYAFANTKNVHNNIKIKSIFLKNMIFTNVFFFKKKERIESCKRDYSHKMVVLMSSLHLVWVLEMN